jgi:hypothetical protein
MSSDLIERARKAYDIVYDMNLPLWKRLKESIYAYSGLNLTPLPATLRKQVEKTFLQVDHILSKYDIQDFDDYQKISPDDLLEGIIQVSGISIYILHEMKTWPIDKKQER